MNESPHPAARRDLDSVNRPTWAQRETVRLYERLQGWTDPGEQAAVEYIAERVRGNPVLDIGVGAGRTTALLRGLGADYVGIDYTAEMVSACRRLHPGVRIEQMDARDLSAFGDGSFALVMFSFNGIDAVDPGGRRRILAEVRRVLQPGGTFLFSAHNHDGPGRGEQPQLKIPFTWNPVKLGWRGLKLAGSLPRALLNHRRFSALNETHESWSVMNAGAHNFGIVVMYTSLDEQKRQLQEHGFECEAVFESTRGARLADGAASSDAWWFHYVARKAQPPARPRFTSASCRSATSSRCRPGRGHRAGAAGHRLLAAVGLWAEARTRSSPTPTTCAKPRAAPSRANCCVRARR